jgi:hypothetical protein
MSNLTGDAAFILTQQLCELYDEIQRSKEAHRQWCATIWPEAPWGIGPSEPELVLSIQLEGCK